MLITKIVLAALSRTDVLQKGRSSSHLYVDEIHNLLTLSFADILFESRRYGLNLIFAHQYIGQIDEKMRLAIFGNVGTTSPSGWELMRPDALSELRAAKLCSFIIRLARVAEFFQADRSDSQLGYFSSNLSAARHHILTI